MKKTSELDAAIKKTMDNREHELQALRKNMTRDKKERGWYHKNGKITTTKIKSKWHNRNIVILTCPLCGSKWNTRLPKGITKETIFCKMPQCYNLRHDNRNRLRANYESKELYEFKN